MTDAMDYITLSVFGGMVLAGIAYFIRSILPAIIKRFSNKQEIESDKDKHEFESDKRQEAEAVEAQKFLTDFAMDSIAQVREIADENKLEIQVLRERLTQQATDYGKLLAGDEIKQKELERIARELTEYKASLEKTKNALSVSQSQIEKMKLEIITLQEEIRRLEGKSVVLEEKLVIEKTNSRKLQDEILKLQEDLRQKERMIVAERETSDMLRKREQELINQLSGKSNQ